MRHMVRILVGTMLAAAGGRRAGGLRPAPAPGGRAPRRPIRRPPTASTWRACATEGMPPLRLSSKAVKVLLTNDDGIEAIGLRVMREALLEVPDMELAVIAPDSNRSATARSITTRQPLWVEEVDFGDGGSGFATDGTPVDCVRFAALGPRRVRAGADRVRHQPRRQPRRRHHLLGHRRRGARGRRARHPRHRRLPAGLPRRLDSWVPHDWQRADFEQAAAFVARMVEEVAEVPMPEGTLLNVNCPAGEVRARAPAGSASASTATA